MILSVQIISALNILASLGK